MSMPYIICQHCDEEVEVQQDLTGRKVQCYFCEGKFVVDRVLNRGGAEAGLTPVKAAAKQSASGWVVFLVMAVMAGLAWTVLKNPQADEPEVRAIGGDIVPMEQADGASGVVVGAANGESEAIKEAELYRGLPQRDGGQIIAKPIELKASEGMALEEETGDWSMPAGEDLVWRSRLRYRGKYQVWVTYYCEEDSVVLDTDIMGQREEVELLNIGRDQIIKFYDADDQVIRKTKQGGLQQEPEPYYFRHYLGTHELDHLLDIELALNGGDIRIHELELVKERDFPAGMRGVMNASLQFYQYTHAKNSLVSEGWDGNRGGRIGYASIANCGVGLMAHTMSHKIDRFPEARDRVLELLRAVNGKIDGLKPARHETGFFMHFVNPKSGAGKSEISTIDTSILMSGALMARNVFAEDAEIVAEADELWHSIDWGAAVFEADETFPKFALTGEQIDGKAKGSISMFNEYILLAWFCQHFENQEKGDTARSGIMPTLSKLPRMVFRNRVMLTERYGGFAPSFLVIFPFYMSDLCADKLYFSYTAAQATADHSFGMTRYGGDITAWGVAPGCTPERGYSVDEFHKNPEGVVGPRIQAAFAPVLPQAVDGLKKRFAKAEHRLNGPFGEILPRFVPGSSWQPNRIAGVDFSCLMFGMAAMNPDLGIQFFEENLKFTFPAKKD